MKEASGPYPLSILERICQVAIHKLEREVPYVIQNILFVGIIIAYPIIVLKREKTYMKGRSNNDSLQGSVKQTPNRHLVLIDLGLESDGSSDSGPDRTNPGRMSRLSTG